MNDCFQQKGDLSVSIGEGYLSAFETGTLKPGDVVRTARMAGYSAMLSYNGIPMAQCEVVILGDLFGVRIVSLDPPRDPMPAPGVRDDLTEMLPVSVCLGSIRVSLEDLRGVGIQTIVSLGRPFSREADAELLAAGVPLARGKVVVIEEEFGLRVTEVLGAGLNGEDVRASGFILDPGSPRQVKDYDFKRPDRFSRNQILRLSEIHLLFLRNLRTRFPDAVADPASRSPVTVDQCTFGEAMEGIRKHGDFRCLALENWPARRAQAPMDLPRSPAPRKLLLEEEGTAHPESARSRAFLEKWSRDFGAATNRNPVLVYARKGGSADALLARPGEADAFLSCLRGGWRSVADMNLRPAPEGEDYLAKAPIHYNEMVITVEAADFVLVYPYLTLEPLMGVLA